MPDYPYCEIKIIYDCQLCKDKHVATVRQRNSVGAEGTLTNLMTLVKKDIVMKFFEAHPAAEKKDLKLDKLTAIETIAYNANEVDNDKVGVPISKEEIEGWRKEFLGDKEGTTSLDGLAPINTDIPASASFSGVKAMVHKKLEQLKEEEKTLAARLLLVQNEKKKFEKLWAAALEVKEEEENESANL